MSEVGLAWVVLTRGDRPEQLRAAVRSIQDASENAASGETEIVVVLNGCGHTVDSIDGVQFVQLEHNEGVPGGRHVGVMATTAPIVAFLDDDAEIRSPDAVEKIRRQFDSDPRVGAISCRLVDESNRSARRHVPRLGSKGAERPGHVVTFLGGASAVRRTAYDDAGGYWGALFYGHEELELSWRLIDRNHRICYLPDVEVFHPHTEIGRHSDGWRMTGRNRVWIARRGLPWPIAFVHTLTWLVAGVFRAPSATCQRSYLAGWWSGWRGRVEHRPIRWRTVWELTRLGRPPVI